MGKRELETYSKRQTVRLKKILKSNGEPIHGANPVRAEQRVDPSASPEISNESDTENSARDPLADPVHNCGGECEDHGADEDECFSDAEDCSANCYCGSYQHWNQHDAESSESDEDETDLSEEDSEEEEEEEEDGFSDCEAADCDYQDQDENQFDSTANEPLYEGAPITVVESIMSILSVVLTFKVSGVLFSKILELIELHCPKRSKCISTLYRFKKFFRNLRMPLTQHFFCSNCLMKMRKKLKTCPRCRKEVQICYFLEIPLIPQLRKLLKKPGFFEMISTHRFQRRKSNPDNMEDIYDGSVYKSLFLSGFLSVKSNFSFTWNTDGVPLFKSSKISIWPLYLSINELPFKERFKKENMIIGGIWIGVKKPVPNLYLGVFRDSLKKLYRGVYFKTDTGERVKCRSQIICGTCDLGAKCLFLNLKQHNGSYGCHTCKIPGEKNPHTQNSRVYPYADDLPLRTTQETIDFAKELPERKKIDPKVKDVCGVKGPSILAEIVHDFMNTTTIDIMHLYINIMKKIMSIWFDAEYSNHPASLRAFIPDINKILASLSPIEGVPRHPRSLDDFAHWKASELKAFLLYYSLPVLSRFMQGVYLKHHSLLVFALTMLNMPSISEEMMANANTALNDYVRRFQTLYGIEHMTMCIHLLLHLVDAVRKFGPLYITSCFPFENLNGILKSFVHGSKYPELQIHASLSLMFNLTDIKASNLVTNENVLSFCKRTEKRSQRRRKLVEIYDKTYVLGSWFKEKNFTELRLALIRKLKDNSHLYFFKRLFMNGVVYETKSYSKNKKKNSSCCIYCTNERDYIGIINSFVKICDCNSKSPLDCTNRITCNTYALINRCHSRNIFQFKKDEFIPTIFRCEEDGDIIDVISLENIKCVCFTIKVDDLMYAVKPCNFEEME